MIVVPNINYIFWKRPFGRPGTEQREITELFFDLKQWRGILSRNGLVVSKTYQDKWFADRIHVFQAKNPVSLLRAMFYKLPWKLMPLTLAYQFIFICVKQHP